MFRLTKTSRILGFLGCLGLLASCSPRVATSFWRIGTPADSIRAGYTVIHAEGKTRHCYPITEWATKYGAPSVNQRSVCDGESGGTSRPVDLAEWYQHHDLVAEREDTYHQLHHHGVAVESELMAYRIYFDKKQTIDPYCKHTPQLELAQSHWYPNDSLLAAGYGDDILRVSGTVGVGSVKYWNGKKMVHIEPVAERSQRIVQQTRTSATIEVAVKGWNPRSPRDPSIPSPLVNMTTRYTMLAGHRDMRCDVSLSEPVEGLCTGVQFIPAKSSTPRTPSDTSIIILPNGVLLASWGTDWPVNDSAKYAKETVGLAVFIPKAYAGALVHDKQNNLCLLRTNKETKKDTSYTAHFYLTCVGATKENHPVATNATEWLIYLRRWAKHLR